MRIVKDKYVRDKKGAARDRSSPFGFASKHASKPAAKPVAKRTAQAPQRVPTASTPIPACARGDGQPVMRLRTALICFCVVAAVMILPLGLVWKQAYINQVSIRLENRSETLKKLNGEITKLHLECGRLSTTERVERIAASRGFEYPQTSRVVILDVEQGTAREDGRIAGFFSRVKSFILGSKG